MHGQPLTPPRPILAICRELIAFLRFPQVMAPAGLRSGASWRMLTLLTVLQVAGLVLVVLPVISFWQSRFALPAPDAFGKLPAAWMVPVTLLGAPLLEEVIFRGWQTGRPRALWLLGCLVAFAGLVMAAPKLPPLAVAGLLVALLLATLAGWLWLRKRAEPPHLYLAAYPAVFWLVVVSFAAAHLTNYPSISLLALPMVLPQLWAAALLGFTRQRLGLPAAILQHACSNAASLLLAMAG